MKYGYAWVCTVWVVCTSKWMGLSDFFRCAINSCFNRGAWLSNGFKGTLCSDKPARWSAGEVANYCSWVTSSYKWLTDDPFSLNIISWIWLILDAIWIKKSIWKQKSSNTNNYCIWCVSTSTNHKNQRPLGLLKHVKTPTKTGTNILISYHIQRKSRQVTRVRNASVLRSYMFSSWFEWWSVISSWKFSIWRGVFGISLCGTQKHLETLENVGVRNCDFRKATVIPCNSDIEMPFFGIWANYIKRL